MTNWFPVRPAFVLECGRLRRIKYDLNGNSRSMRQSNIQQNNILVLRFIKHVYRSSNLLPYTLIDLSKRNLAEQLFRKSENSKENRRRNIVDKYNPKLGKLQTLDRLLDKFVVEIIRSFSAGETRVEETELKSKPKQCQQKLGG